MEQRWQHGSPSSASQPGLPSDDAAQPSSLPGSAALPESFHSHNGSSGGCSSSVVQPAGASASGVAQPTMTLGASEFAAAPNCLGALPFSLEPMAVADARAVSIPPMAWGIANPVSVLKHWARRIAVPDPLRFNQCSQDPHVYLVTKLFQTLSIIKRQNARP